MCSETRITSDILDSEIDIEGYISVRCNSHSRHTGGVVAYVRKDIRFKEMLNNSFDKNIWFLTIEIKNSEMKGIYTVIYHSPSASDALFLKHF